MAALTEERVASMLSTTPLRRPVDGATPTPMISSWSSSLKSPTTARVEVVPISRPTIKESASLCLLVSVHDGTRAEIDLFDLFGALPAGEDIQDQ
jgi:hypothetical protein